MKIYKISEGELLRLLQDQNTLDALYMAGIRGTDVWTGHFDHKAEDLEWNDLKVYYTEVA